MYTEAGVIPDVRKREAGETVKDFEKIIIENGYSKEDAFLCDLMFYNTGGGSRKAKDNTDKMLKSFQDNLGYKYLFASITDLSGMEGNENEES